MKKGIGLLLLSCMLFLTSCRVNWFDRHYDVPWWFVAVPVVIILLLTWIIAGKYIANKIYVCEKCGKTFSPKWWRSAFSLHFGSNRVFTCPHCKYRGFCRSSHDSEKD